MVMKELVVEFSWLLIGRLSFFSELNINNCQQMIHLPHCDVNMV
jgi:hypothetical protein